MARLGSPAWLCDNQKTCVAPHATQVSLAAELTKYLHRRRHVLHEPDMWVDPVTLKTTTTPKHEQYVALRPGDTVHYANVLNLPYVTHDMVYVGAGFVVGFVMWSAYAGYKPAVDITFLGSVKTKGHRLTFNRTRSVLPRADVCSRALQSIGGYVYKPLTFNCQHVVERILGNAWHSVGAVRVVATGLVVLAIALTALLVFQGVLMRRIRGH